MKRGQMEVFGMVFVVLLILVGFLMYIILNPKSGQPAALGAEYERTQMASSFIDAVLKTTTNCSGQDLGYLLASCEDEAAHAGSLLCEDGKDPCEEATDILALALERTLGEMDYRYQLQFRVKRGANWENPSTAFPIPSDELTCVERVRAGIYPFQSHLTRRMLELRLDICR